MVHCEYTMVHSQYTIYTMEHFMGIMSSIFSYKGLVGHQTEE